VTVLVKVKGVGVRRSVISCWGSELAMIPRRGGRERRGEGGTTGAAVKVHARTKAERDKRGSAIIRSGFIVRGVRGRGRRTIVATLRSGGSCGGGHD